MNLLWLAVCLGTFAYVHSWGIRVGAGVSVGGIGIGASVGFMFGKRDLAGCRKKVCGRTCKRTGVADDVECFFSCLKMCQGFNTDEKTQNGHLVPLPLDFNFYDSLGEGRFNIKGLAAAYGARADDEGLMDTFREADVNGDGYITPEELGNAHWLFEGQEEHVSDNGDAVPPPRPLKELTEKMRPEHYKPEEGNNEEVGENSRDRSGEDKGDRQSDERSGEDRGDRLSGERSGEQKGEEVERRELITLLRNLRTLLRK